MIVAVAFLFFFRTDSTDSPDCLVILLCISAFLLFSFSVFHFIVVGSVPQITLTHVTVAFERTLK